jgi:hypothetical protein
MNKIVALLEIQKLTRDAQNDKELGFVATNKTSKIYPYQQAVFWTHNNGIITIVSVSGNAVLDDDGPYAIWVKDEIRQYIKTNDTTIKHVGYNNQLTLGGKHNYIVPFHNTTDGMIGGLFIECDKEMNEDSRDLISELSEHYTQSLALIRLRKNSKSLFSLGRLSKHRKYILIALLIIMLIPVRLSITAPAEIVAKSPVTITAPYDGILEDIKIKPGDTINAGDILAIMDKTQIQSQKDTAAQAMRMAQTSLSRTGMESLRNNEKKVDLMRLQSEIKIKRIELDYANSLLKKTDIIAPKDGVAIFSDVSSLRNKPVQMGERIMMIANPDEYELLIRIPAQNLLPLTLGDTANFFLNVRPFDGMTATISTIGYQASTDDDGLLTYKIRAVMNGDSDIRIGWQGTAKIKTNWTIFGYSLLRRPLIAMRNMLGI